MRIRVRRRERHVSETRGPIQVLEEVRNIVNRAAQGDSRVVGLGQLVFFSTQTGDAWALDPDDGSALCLARGGDAQPVHIEETEDRFAIEWTHRYRIGGSTMTFISGDETTSADDYPTREILRTARRLRKG